MMHQLTIDQKACRGVSLCHGCEAITPGLVEFCSVNGRLLISAENTAIHSSTISRLVAACPVRAIFIKSIGDK